MTHNCSLEGTVKPLYQAVSCRVVRGCSDVLYPAHLSEVFEQLGLELAPLICCNCLWATKTSYPPGQQGAPDCFRCNVMYRVGFWPACETIDCCQTILFA